MALVEKSEDSTWKFKGAGRIILKWIFERWEGMMWTGFIWLSTGASGGLLCTRY
jgi:hypothetical protein